MDRWVALVMGSLLLFAGCLGEDAPADQDTGGDDVMDDETRAPLPEAIQAEETVTGSADPANFVTGQPCTNEMACTEYPFTTEANVRLNAELTWTNDASDFDLYLYEGDEQVAVSGNTPPGTMESFSTTLSPGDYRIIVVAWAVSQDTYTLSGVFEHA